MNTKVLRGLPVFVAFLVSSYSGAGDVALSRASGTVTSNEGTGKQPTKKVVKQASVSKQNKNVRLYNPRVKARFAEGPVLKCDGQEEPNDYNVPLESNEEPVLDNDWGLRLTGINLRYVGGKFPGTFDIERTLFLETNSEQLQRKVIGGDEKHGCDEELYPVGSQFDASGDEIAFTSRVFAAKRVCVNRYWGGRTAVCSAESTLSGGARFRVEFSQTYDDCRLNSRNGAALQLETISQSQPQGGKNANCLGVNVENIPIITGLLTHIGVGIVAKLVLDNNTKMPQSSLPPMPLHEVKRPANDAVTVCPLRIQNKNVSSSVVQIASTEGMRNMVAGLACHLYRSHRRQLMQYAESLAPTKTITIEKGDNYWEVARRLWGDGRLYPLVERTNNWKSNLAVGTQIEVPEINRILSEASTVKEGDTLWDAAIRLKSNPSGFVSLQRRVRPLPEDPDRIFPFSVIEPAKPQKH